MINERTGTLNKHSVEPIWIYNLDFLTLEKGYYDYGPPVIFTFMASCWTFVEP